MKMCIERGRRVWWPHEQLAILVNKNVRSGSQGAHRCQKGGVGLGAEGDALCKASVVVGFGRYGWSGESRQ